MLQVAISNGDVIILIVAVAVPIAALSFLGAGKAFDQIGKGGLSIEQEIPQKGSGGGAPVSAGSARRRSGRSSRPSPTGGSCAASIRSTSRRSWRRQSPQEASSQRRARWPATPSSSSEVRELVIARNARRERQGKEPLDVEAEVARQLQRARGARPVTPGLGGCVRNWAGCVASVRIAPMTAERRPARATAPTSSRSWWCSRAPTSTRRPRSSSSSTTRSRSTRRSSTWRPTRVSTGCGSPTRCPVDEHSLEEAMEEFQTHHHVGSGGTIAGSRG